MARYVVFEYNPCGLVKVRPWKILDVTDVTNRQNGRCDLTKCLYWPCRSQDGTASDSVPKKGYHTASPSRSRSIHLSRQMLHCIRLQRRPVSTIAHDVSLSSTEDSGYCQVYPSRDTAVGWPQTPGSSWRWNPPCCACLTPGQRCEKY